MFKFLPSWMTRPYSVVAGCALCSGIAVGLIDDLRHQVTGAFYAVVFPEPTCIDSALDGLGTPAPGVYRIILTELVNDADLTQTRLVDRTLRRLYGDDPGSVIQLAVLPCKVYATIGYADQRRADAEALASRIAEASSADVVLWGEVIEQDNLINLSMTHATDTEKVDYEVEQSSLTTDFGADMGWLIATKMLILVNLAAADAGTYLVPRMERVLALTTPLVTSPPAQMTELDRGSLFLAHAEALSIIGQQSGDNAKLQEAVAAYSEALKGYTCACVPLDWAYIHNNLGNVLAILGEREGGTARLVAAVAAYTEALKEYTREKAPLDWAATQNSLGAALLSLGEREPGTARLKAAVAVYTEALKERTRERVPLDWAATQNNLGAALEALGRREPGTAQLEAAVAAYTEALKEYTRERLPLEWATSWGNQGMAMRLLAERTGELSRASQALRQVTEAEAELRAGGHMPHADYFAGQISQAQMLVDKLTP